MFDTASAPQVLTTIYGPQHRGAPLHNNIDETLSCADNTRVDTRCTCGSVKAEAITMRQSLLFAARRPAATP